MRNRSVILQIGLVRYEPSWELLFRQIGIPWKTISADEFFPERYSVIIINDTLDESTQTAIKSFIDAGGAVLYTSSTARANYAKTIKNKFIASLPPTQKLLYSTNGILDIYERCFIFSNNDVVELESSGNGYKAYLGIPCEAILSSKTLRKNFPSDSARMPNEIVSRNSKGTFRELIFSLFVHLHRIQNIPFVHTWYYPGGAPTIFTFRIDSDKGTQEQIEEIYQLSEKYSIPTTWFLDVKSHEGWISYFTKFVTQEIGVHCYEHRISHDKELNIENFLKAKTIVEKQGIDAKGFSAPTGMWNESLASATEDLRFHYSSEFGCDYDNLPSFPMYSGKFSHVPQLPIHPICIGSMLRARMSDKEMVSYYKKIIDTNYLLHEPICLYHHPTHKHNEVFQEIFHYIQDKKILSMSFSEYASWWKKRDAQSVCWRYDGNTLSSIDQESEDIHFRIILPDGKEAIFRKDNIIEIKRLKSVQSIGATHPVKDIMGARKFDIRHILQNGLDWWIKETE